MARPDYKMESVSKYVENSGAEFEDAAERIVEEYMGEYMDQYMNEWYIKYCKESYFNMDHLL